MGSDQTEQAPGHFKDLALPIDPQPSGQQHILGVEDWPGDILPAFDSSVGYEIHPWTDLSVSPQFHLNPNLALPSSSPSLNPCIWPPFDLSDFGDPHNHQQNQALASNEQLDPVLTRDGHGPFIPLEGLDQMQLGSIPFNNNATSWDNVFSGDSFAGPLSSPAPFPAFLATESTASREDSCEALSESSTIVSPDNHLKKTKSSSPYDEPENQFLTDDERWQATGIRSRAADRHFLYGVRTTKIFCRPSCASRRAGRQHVQFFPFPDAIKAAYAAGFRPCKRCCPDQLGVIDKGSKGVVKALIAIIRDAFEPMHNKSATCSLKLEDLARAADLSPFHFQRVFKAATQITPGDFSTACKSLSLQDALAKQLCTCFDFPVAMTAETLCSACKIMEQCSRWTDRTAKKALGGVKPVEYTNGMPNTTVKYVSVPSPPGQAYVSYSGKGLVHSVLIGGDALPKTQLRFEHLEESHACAAKLEQSIQNMHTDSKDRDTEIPNKQLHTLWRARIWLMVVRDSLLDG